MKLCIPTLDSQGYEGRLSPHFGSAPYFTILDTQSDNLELVRNRGSHHTPGACDPVGGLQGHTVDAVVCTGLGKRALTRLQRQGIEVYMTTASDVSHALHQFRTGQLAPLTVDQACGGGRHGRGHCSH